MTFPSQFLDEIRGRLSLTDVIGRRVRLVRKGREASGLCPFHNEKTPSFTVNDDKGFFHCFGCGAHGDVIGFTMRAENLPFPEAVEKLAAEAGLDLPKQTPQERERVRAEKTLGEAVEAACRWFEKQLRLPAGRGALDYLRNRGLAEETIARFRLGFAPDSRTGLKAALLAEGFPERILVEAGLLIVPEEGRETFDRFRGRVMFPIADRKGRVIAFGGRVMGDGQPKYLNSPETPLFHKGRVLYGLAHALAPARERGAVIVTEGYMDVIALHQAGFTHAMAPLGTALTEEQIALLWRVAPEPILCFDGDAAGQRAAARAAERALPVLKPGLSLRFAVLPKGEDPDSLIKARGPRAMEAVLEAAGPLSDVLWRLVTEGRPVDTPERRASLERQIEDTVLKIADRTVQTHYRSVFKDRLWQALRAAQEPRFRRGAKDKGKGAASALPGARGRLPFDPSRLQQQIILATLINHPKLAEEMLERLGALDFPAPDLDKLRQEIINTVAGAPGPTSGGAGLDSSDLKLHLSRTGFEAALETLLSSQVYVHAAFARPGASLDLARQGWLHTVALYQRRDLEAEIDEAERRLAADGSTAAFEMLRALQNQERRVREIDGDETEDGLDPVNLS